MEYSELKKRYFGNNDTNKKLTDEEIIMRLEWCVSRGNRNYDIDIVLDLIRRQKAETLRLKSMNQAKLDTIHDLQTEIEGLKEKQEKCFYCTEQANKKISEIKSEAYKEFAEELKHILRNTPKLSIKKLNFNNVVFYDDVLFIIDNLLKEMVGDEE